jgi:hypothetical protein
VALAFRSMAGQIRLSASSRLSTSSLLPVPLNSSKMTSSMREPVSTSAVAMMVSEPPPCFGSMLRALPRNRFGFSSAFESRPPVSVLPLLRSFVLYARASRVMESRMMTTSWPISTLRRARSSVISATPTCRSAGWSKLDATPRRTRTSPSP